jgi:hypothetical protein
MENWEGLRKALEPITKAVSEYWNRVKMSIQDAAQYRRYQGRLARVDQLLLYTKQTVRRNKLLKERKIILKVIGNLDSKYGRK